MRPMSHALLVLSLVILGQPSASHADCASDAKNLLAAHDCGFAKGIGGWEANEGAQVAHAAKDGHSQPGSIEGVAPNGSLLIQGPCVAAKPNTTYRFGASVRLVKGSTYVCGPQVYHFADAECDDSLGPLTAMSDLVEEGWRAFDPARRPESGPDQDLATTKAGTHGLRILLACSGEAGFVVRFDDVSLTPRQGRRAAAGRSERRSPPPGACVWCTRLDAGSYSPRHAARARQRSP